LGAVLCRVFFNRRGRGVLQGFLDGDDDGGELAAGFVGGVAGDLDAVGPVAVADGGVVALGVVQLVVGAAKGGAGLL
jgi:hypothetical protein